MSRIIFVTGGARSGKSRYALEESKKFSKKAFIATAEVMDDEMRLRILNHREERGDDYFTIEEPLDLAAALKAIPGETEIAVVDCLTVWLGNLMHYRSNEADRYAEVTAFIDALAAPPCDLIIISNEVGMGIVPETAMGRRFRDLSGKTNQAVAEIADKVVFLVSGIPMIIKGNRE